MDEEFVSVCPACGEFIDYCQGHGEIGDPEGFRILEMHDAGNHSECAPGVCEPDAEEPDLNFHNPDLRREWAGVEWKD